MNGCGLWNYVHRNLHESFIAARWTNSKSLTFFKQMWVEENLIYLNIRRFHGESTFHLSERGNKEYA
jgi:hypothetical protein